MKPGISREAPFGWDQGDPLVVCVNQIHMENVQKAFQLKAYYCLSGAAVGGRKFRKIIVFHREMHPIEQDEFQRWINSSLRTCLDADGEMLLV